MAENAPIPADGQAPVIQAEPAPPTAASAQDDNSAFQPVVPSGDGWRPTIPDKVRLIAWFVFGTVSVSTGPAFGLSILPWANYGPEVAIQAGGLITAWVGGMAALLGLSNFTRSK